MEYKILDALTCSSPPPPHSCDLLTRSTCSFSSLLRCPSVSFNASPGKRCSRSSALRRRIPVEQGDPRLQRRAQGKEGLRLCEPPITWCLSLTFPELLEIFFNSLVISALSVCLPACSVPQLLALSFRVGKRESNTKFWTLSKFLAEPQRQTPRKSQSLPGKGPHSLPSETCGHQTGSKALS